MGKDAMDHIVKSSTQILKEIQKALGNENVKLEISTTFNEKFEKFLKKSDNHTGEWEFVVSLLDHYFSSGQEDICKFIVTNSETIVKDLTTNDHINSFSNTLFENCITFSVKNPDKYSSYMEMVKLVLEQGITTGIKSGYSVSNYDFSEQEEYLKQLEDVMECLKNLGVNLDF